MSHPPRTPRDRAPGCQRGGRQPVRRGTDSHSATGARGCCAPRTATRWSCSARRSRASRRGSRSRTSSNGKGRRSWCRSSPTFSTRHSPPARSAAKCWCSTRSVSGSSRATRGRRSPARAAGMGHFRPRSGWPPPARLDTSTVKGGSFWSQAAEQRLAPLLYAAARTGRGMGEVVRWVYGQGGAELDRIMHDLVEDSRGPLERADAQQAHDAHLAFCRARRGDQGVDRGHRADPALRLPLPHGGAVRRRHRHHRATAPRGPRTRCT